MSQAYTDQHRDAQFKSNYGGKFDSHRGFVLDKVTTHLVES